MIAVIVSEHDFFHIGKVDSEFTRVLEDGIRPGASIHQHAMPIGLHEGGESPLSNTPVSQHGGKDGYFQSVDLGLITADRVGGSLSTGSAGAKKDEYTQPREKATPFHTSKCKPEWLTDLELESLLVAQADNGVESCRKIGWLRSKK